MDLETKSFFFFLVSLFLGSFLSFSSFSTSSKKRNRKKKGEKKEVIRLIERKMAEETVQESGEDLGKGNSIFLFSTSLSVGFLATS